MTPFATDTDLLHWEPNLFTDAAAAAQTMLSGDGELAGETFTLTSGSLADAHVAADHVIILSGAIAGAFPIISIDSATTLTLSVLYDEITSQAEPCPPGTATGLQYIIRTFWPQRSSISESLLQAAGIAPENVAQILNPTILRRPCTLGALHMIYTAMAAGAAEPAPLLMRVDLYERLYRRALRSVAIELDTDGDGRVNDIRALSVLSMRRA